ncbi:MAG: S1 family peptidase [Propionibacteriaceae bacterium]|nr:S1 family peptidase [Propionibacteriaceae bacterium]
MNQMRRPILLSLACATLAAAAVLSTTTAVAAPAGNPSAYGLTIVKESAVVPPHLVEAFGFARSVAMARPDDFGFPQVVDDTVVLPAVSDAAVNLATARPQTVREQLEQYARPQLKDGDTMTQLSVPDFSAIWGRVTLVASAEGLTAGQVLKINDAVFDLRNDATLPQTDIVSTGIDASGRVVLTVREMTAPLAGKVIEEFGVEVVVVNVDANFTALPADRASDTSPYYGGARITTPSGGGCTSGFAWTYSNPMMLTAGHCSPNGGTYTSPSGKVMGTVTSGSRENWDAGVGTVYFSGQTVHRGDLALISLASGVSSSGRIFTGLSQSS